MSSMSPVSHDAFGPVGVGYSTPGAPTAPPAAPAAIAPQSPPTPAAIASSNPGTEADVVSANIAAQSSSHLLDTSNDDYASAMSKVVSQARANAPKLGGRLDTQM